MGDMSAEELAALVCHTLNEAGVTVTLTGGTCVSIWGEGRYVSDDLDFIEEGIVSPHAVRRALAPLGFRKEGRHFVHPDTHLLVEFPTGPLMVGEQRVERAAHRHTPVGVLRLLTPTDCVKDRLAAYFHWGDRQALEQAVLVAGAQTVDLRDIHRWAIAERMEQKFDAFRRQLRGGGK